MRAVVFKAPRELAVEDVPDARVERDDDVVVRVTSSALCGTDLHMYDGRTGAVPGMVLGHEGLGIVEVAGPAVHRVKRGDRVVLPAHIYCGVCFNCSAVRRPSWHGFPLRTRTAWYCPVSPGMSMRTILFSLLTRG